MPGNALRVLAWGAICLPMMIGLVGCERAKPLSAAPPPAETLFAPTETTPASSGNAGEIVTVEATPSVPAAYPSPSLEETTPTAEVAPLPAQPGESAYLVMEGDTWASIATDIHCDADLILARNLLSGDVEPLPGQQVIIPAECLPAALPDGEITAAPDETTTALPDETAVATPTPLLGEAATLYPTALPADTTATPAVIQHVVRQGDTLSSLARQYATTVAEIKALNTSIADPNYLTPGTSLSIRPNTAPATRTHRVTRGETLSSIARRYGVSVAALSQANGLSNPNQVVAGQILVIP